MILCERAFINGAREGTNKARNLLIAADLAERHGAWAVPVGLLDATCRGLES